MAESEEDRERRATNLAFARGRREAEVDGRLQSHEARLNAINGSIERSARRSAELAQSVDQQGDKIDRLITQNETRVALEADRDKRLREASQNQLNDRTFKIGVLTVVVMLLGVMLTLLVSVHAI